MKILITGNLGYVGSELTKTLRKKFPGSTLIGYDMGYYAKYLTNNSLMPEVYLDSQIYGDVCELPADILKGVDTVVQLAAISNDPIGNKFEKVTYKVNHKAVVEIAEKAKKQGVKNIVFASSCSVYGFAEESERTEQSEVGPITAYAKSKVYAEKDLEALASDNFKITCLRFATACGISDRLRLDLVLNDFVAGALTSKEITILSDGTPWRPLINVKDMGRAIIWAHLRKPENGGNFLIVNTGSNEWNYQVKDLAKHINDILPEIKVTINKDAQPDKRSYKVNFDLFNRLSRDYQPEYDINTTIKELIDGLNAIEFRDKDFRKSKLMRLNVINELLEKGIIDSNLKFRK
jgi:nucleoside-diphosphate-sugar epimerase